jgi:predicted enzyme related to lactoylglutathione lyase
MTSRIASVAIDAGDPGVLAEFWCQVLGWKVVDQDDTLISIEPADGGPGIDLIAVPEAKTVKNRLHLDLRADGSTQAEEVDRLVALGARRVDVGQGPDVSWVVLADPEDNEFCVLSRSVQDV